jgi:GNAT superfamily N-acetyltransferase
VTSRPSEVEILEVATRELALLERDLPSPHHRQRAAAHRSGAATFLVAVRRGEAVGYLVIKWTGADERVVHRRIGDCPELNAITVAPALQSRGIGTALIEAAERRVAARGHFRVGLGVGIGNPRARALYERLGYRAWAHGRYDVSWDVPGDPPKREHETCVYMLKRLA